MLRESGLAGAELRGGEGWEMEEEVGRKSFCWYSRSLLPSGLCPEHGGQAEEEYIGGGCGSPGHCFCGGEERCGLGSESGQGFWGAWAEWPLDGFGEAGPASSPPSSSSFLLGPGDHLLLLSGEKYPKWL